MNELLAGLIEEAGARADEAQQSFGHLSAEQLAWKPAADQWSVAECLQHLILINSAYFPTLEKIARGEYKPSLWARVPLLPRLFTPLVMKAVRPQSQHKFKTNPKFEPSASAPEGARDILPRFLAHQRDLIEHMRSTENVDLGKVIIISPAASVATYSVIDAYRIIVTHERRHLEQARRVTQAEGFGRGPVRTDGAASVPR